jgi:hypothetical protein
LGCKGTAFYLEGHGAGLLVEPRRVERGGHGEGPHGFALEAPQGLHLRHKNSN